MGPFSTSTRCSRRALPHFFMFLLVVTTHAIRFGTSFIEQDGTYTYVMPRKNGDAGLPVAAGEMDH